MNITTCFLLVLEDSFFVFCFVSGFFGVLVNQLVTRDTSLSEIWWKFGLGEGGGRGKGGGGRLNGCDGPFRSAMIRW